jgi:uncharacterized membrane protein
MHPFTLAVLVSEPTTLFALLAAIIAVVFWLSKTQICAPFFKYLPPILWVYYLPMFATTLGITPAESPTYAWMARYLLPIALFLLMITVDLKAIVRLGKIAIIMMFAGTAGIVIGGPIAYAVFGHFLEPNAWQGFAGIAGSWIGGSVNMVAVVESIEAPPDVLGPAIVVDTVVGYGWLGIVLYMSIFQERFDKWIGADNSVIEETNRRLQELDQHRRPVEIVDLAKMIGISFVVAVIAIALSDFLPSIGDPTIISATTWVVLIVVTVGLLLSFTPMRNLEHAGASKVGYMTLYLLLAGIGAQADLRAVLEAPMYLAAGMLWIAIHVGILILVARWVKAPLFFVATGSIANVGGAVSAPIAAGVYHRAMAPVGLLMAVSGYILGIYAALFCAYLLSLLAA